MSFSLFYSKREENQPFSCVFSDSKIDTQKLREVIHEAEEKCQQLSAERYVPCLLRDDVANKTGKKSQYFTKG